MNVLLTSFLALARLCLAVCLSVAVFTPAWADRHEGYYYPELTSSEIYTARAQELPGADRQKRIGFVTALTLQAREAPYPPRMAVFSKGAEHEKLIITALDDGVFRTLYRARGVLAQMTAQARVTPIFEENQVAEIFTFLDLLKMLGFQQVTITNGTDFAHQIIIE